jgi:hypothetical protein
MLGILRNQFKSFNGFAAAGFNSNQTSNFDQYNGCGGIGSKIIGNMSLSGMSGLSSDCIFASSDDSFATIKAEQVKHISLGGASGEFHYFETIFLRSLCDDIIGIKTIHFVNFDFPAAVGFSAQQVSIYNDVVYHINIHQVSVFDSTTGCPGLGFQFMQNLDASALSGLTSSCVSMTPVTSFSTLDADKMAYMTQCGGERKIR